MIVLPVTVLAAFGLVSLRQDALLARKEAEERAQEIANQLVPKVWETLTRRDGEQSRSFQADKEGDLLFPPLAPAFPEPTRLFCRTTAKVFSARSLPLRCARRRPPPRSA